jgi:hypothetical protein
VPFSSESLLFPSRLLLRNLEVKLYKTIILPVVLYGYEIWSLTPREERRLIISENRVMRIFERKRGEVVGVWRRLQNEELHNSCNSLNITRLIK